MPIKPRIIKLHYKTAKKLRLLKKEAEQAGEYRAAKRIHAILLNHQEKPVARLLKLLIRRDQKYPNGLKIMHRMELRHC